MLVVLCCAVWYCTVWYEILRSYCFLVLQVREAMILAVVSTQSGSMDAIKQSSFTLSQLTDVREETSVDSNVRTILDILIHKVLRKGIL